jgi:hypothetical protein
MGVANSRKAKSASSGALFFCLIQLLNIYRGTGGSEEASIKKETPIEASL